MGMTMNVCVLLFALYREAVGEKRIEVELPAGSTAEDLYTHLSAQYPALGRLRPYTTFAVNRETVAPDTILRSGDEVALLQPSSGGRR